MTQNESRPDAGRGPHDAPSPTHGSHADSRSGAPPTEEGSSARRSGFDLAFGEETELNMTPMIDIVFQLIIFFLITLKFKTIDERIDAAMPKHLGMPGTPPPPEEKPKIKLKVFRKNKHDESSAYTLVKIDNTHQLRFPAGTWTGTRLGDQARHKAYEAVVAKLRGIMARKQEALGHDPDLFCELVAPRPDGGAVPEGDVIRLVDTVIALGIKDMRFEGVQMPGGVLGDRPSR